MRCDLTRRASTNGLSFLSLPTAYYFLCCDFRAECALELDECGRGGGEPSSRADAAACALTDGRTGRGRTCDLCAFVFLLHEGATQARINNLPRQQFSITARAARVPPGVRARLAQGRV